MSMKEKLENQLLIQFPDELCEQIATGIDAGKLPPIHLIPVNTKSRKRKHRDTDADDDDDDNDNEDQIQREFEVRVGNDKNYKATLMDLPCIIESQKTYNKNLYFKTGDISQIIKVEQASKKNANEHRSHNNKYILDSGITPPSSNIRERWSHTRPICVHPQSEIDHLCSKCHNVPHSLISKMSQELYHRIHGQPSEVWELITTEEWVEVTDDEDSENEADALNAAMDKKLAHSQTINNEWERESDDDDLGDVNMQKRDRSPQISEVKQTQNESNAHKLSQRHNSNPRHPHSQNIHNNKQPTPSLSKLREAPRPNSMNRNMNNKMSQNRPPSQNRPLSQKRQQSQSLAMNNGSKARPYQQASMSRTPAQPPLPHMSTERRRTPQTVSPALMLSSVKRTPQLRRRTPSQSTPSQTNYKSASNLIIISNASEDASKKGKNKEKKVLQQQLKQKQAMLKSLEDKVKTLTNRKMKQKNEKNLKKVKQEINEIEEKLKAI